MKTFEIITTDYEIVTYRNTLKVIANTQEEAEQKARAGEVEDRDAETLSYEDLTKEEIKKFLNGDRQLIIIENIKQLPSKEDEEAAKNAMYRLTAKVNLKQAIKDLKRLQPSHEATKYPRRCNISGKGMNSGYCWHDGGFYTSTAEITVKQLREDLRKGDLSQWTTTPEEVFKLSDEKLLEWAYNNDILYYTEWEEEPGEGETWYTADGEEMIICHNCKEETIVIEDFNFCTHCLTNL